MLEGQKVAIFQQSIWQPQTLNEKKNSCSQNNFAPIKNFDPKYCISGRQFPSKNFPKEKIRGGAVVHSFPYPNVRPLLVTNL